VVISDVPSNVGIRVTISSAIRVALLIPKLVEEQGDSISLARQSAHYSDPKALRSAGGWGKAIVPVVVVPQEVLKAETNGHS
jgi:hypothetical protein